MESISIGRKFLAALIYCIFLSSIPASAIPINSDLGLTPHKGEFIFRVQGKYLHKGEDPTGQGRTVDEYVVPFVGVYGFTAKTSLLVNLPYINRELKTPNASSRSDHGIGDLTLLGKHRVFTHNFKGGTSRLSLIGGLELPTGDDDETDSLGTLPKGLQLGSGSVDFLAGGAFTYQTLDHELDWDLRYIFNREANDFEFGDVFKYNMAYQKRILPSILPDKGIYSQWNAVLELNGVFEQRAESQGIDVANSGGHTLYLSPGFQYVSKRMIYEFSFQYPIVQELNGSQLETDFSLVFSFRYIL